MAIANAVPLDASDVGHPRAVGARGRLEAKMLGVTVIEVPAPARTYVRVVRPVT